MVMNLPLCTGSGCHVLKAFIYLESSWFRCLRLQSNVLFLEPTIRHNRPIWLYLNHPAATSGLFTTVYAPVLCPIPFQLIQSIVLLPLPFGRLFHSWIELNVRTLMLSLDFPLLDLIPLFLITCDWANLSQAAQLLCLFICAVVNSPYQKGFLAEAQEGI